MDAGNGQHFDNLLLHENTLNVDDEIGDHHWHMVQGNFPFILLPDNFTGVSISTGVGANVWGNDTEILSVASRTKPFRVIGIIVEANANEKFRIRNEGFRFFQ